MRVASQRTTYNSSNSTYKITVLLWRYPHMSITPSTQASKLLDFRMRMLQIILDGQTGWAEDAHVTSEPEKDTSSFKSKKPRIRANELSDQEAMKSLRNI